MGIFSRRVTVAVARDGIEPPTDFAGLAAASIRTAHAP